MSVFPYNYELKFLFKPCVAYWLIHNPVHQGQAVLLHNFGGRSDYRLLRGELFYNKRFSLLFVDGRSHGISNYSLRAYSLAYAEDIVAILEQEHINNPIIYGVSYGVIICLELTKMIDIWVVILASCSETLKTVYWSVLHYVHATTYLFG